jgi:hypothetical protein
MVSRIKKNKNKNKNKDKNLDDKPFNMSLPKTFRQAVFKEAGGPLVLEEANLTLPGAGEILVKVEACGICFSDTFAQYNGANLYGGS